MNTSYYCPPLIIYRGAWFTELALNSKQVAPPNVNVYISADKKRRRFAQQAIALESVIRATKCKRLHRMMANRLVVKWPPLRFEQMAWGTVGNTLIPLRNPRNDSRRRNYRAGPENWRRHQMAANITAAFSDLISA